MCNSWNHPESCGCGFGPPYPWSIELVETVPWTEEILSNKDSFSRALKDLNFDSAAREEWNREYNNAVASSTSLGALRSKLKRLVDGREYRVEETCVKKLRIPLFKLHSPGCKGSKVVYRESVAADTEAGWKVKLFGTGMGRTRTITVTYVAEFKSCEGQCKQVFVPVDLLIERVAVYKSGEFVSRGLRAELANPGDGAALRRRGIESRPAEQCEREVGGSTSSPKEYLLSGDHSDVPSGFKQSWTSNIGRDIELSLSAFGIAIEPLANVRRERQLELEFELPCGHDYNLWFSPGGIHWKIVSGQGMVV